MLRTLLYFLPLLAHKHPHSFTAFITISDCPHQSNPHSSVRPSLVPPSIHSHLWLTRHPSPSTLPTLTLSHPPPSASPASLVKTLPCKPTRTTPAGAYHLAPFAALWQDTPTSLKKTFTTSSIVSSPPYRHVKGTGTPRGRTMKSALNTSKNIWMSTPTMMFPLTATLSMAGVFALASPS